MPLLLAIVTPCHISWAQPYNTLYRTCICRGPTVERRRPKPPLPPAITHNHPALSHAWLNSEPWPDPLISTHFETQTMNILQR